VGPALRLGQDGADLADRVVMVVAHQGTRDRRDAVRHVVEAQAAREERGQRRAGGPVVVAQLVAAGRADLLRPPLDPEASVAALAALRAVAADVEDVLPRS
jgi:hypothetical protein